MSVVQDSVNISGQSNITQLKVPEGRLSEDFGNLLHESLFADCTFAVGREEFHAHKAIVAGGLEQDEQKIILLTFRQSWFDYHIDTVAYYN